MPINFNITEIKGKMINAQGKEIYDPNLEKIIKRNMEAAGRVKGDKASKEEEGENKEK